MIVKFLNRKDAENVYSNKKKLKYVDISCLFSDDDMQGRSDMTTDVTLYQEYLDINFY